MACSLVLLLVLTACGSDDAAMRAAISSQVTSYIRDVSAGRWDEARTLATGGALEALGAAELLYSQASYQNSVSHLTVDVTSLNTKDGLATARASYVQETAIPNVGSEVSHPTLIFQLTRLGGAWRIYSVDLVSQ